MSGEAFTREQAVAIYDVLIEHAGAGEGWRQQFIYHQTMRFCSEFRFMGALGFGGKFWRNYGRRPDGSMGEVWYVSAYPEDVRHFPDMQGVIEETNRHLATLQAASVIP